MRAAYVLLSLTLCLDGLGYDANCRGGAAAAAATMPGSNGTVTAIFVFGDSVVDPGNNNHRPSVAKCNYPPYGRDFPGGKPTGRFSNGLIPPDLIAQFFGVKELVPAYLDPNLRDEDLATGVSFASGGAGFDPLTSQTGTAISLADQLNLFKEYLEKLRGIAGERVETILSNSMTIVCVGNNDIANTYFSTPLRSAHYNISAYTDLLVASASDFLQELYGVGLRKFGVLGLPPLGCVPSQRTAAGGIQRGCAEPRNEASLLFNSKLSSMLKALSAQLPRAEPVFLDIYPPVLSLIQNPAQYGFEEVSRGCCGTGTVEVTFLCNRYNPFTCPDASKYIFWDSYHPTQKAYSILIQDLLGKHAAKFS